MTRNISFSFGAPLPRNEQRATAVSVHDLFVTRIWQARLVSLAPRFSHWIAEVNGLRAASPLPAGRTNRHGWNSANIEVVDLPSFAELRNALVGLCADSLLQTHGAPVAFELKSWINIHDRGGFNFANMHSGCLLSGCFYTQAPPGSGPLVFRDPRPGAVTGEATGGGPNAYTDVRLQPEAGLAVLFPAWLEHFVEVHEGDLPRISLGFNAIRPELPRS